MVTPGKVEVHLVLVMQIVKDYEILKLSTFENYYSYPLLGGPDTESGPDCRPSGAC